MGKTNLTFVKKAFLIEREEKLVECELQFNIDLDRIPGIQMLYNAPEFVDYLNTLSKCIDVKHIKKGHYGKLRFIVRDIAFCATDDVFDEGIGTRLAHTRTQKLAFRTAKCFYRDVLNILNKYLTRIVNLENNCAECEYDCHRHEFEITNSKQ
jgi:hypothetical protein